MKTFPARKLIRCALAGAAFSAWFLAVVPGRAQTDAPPPSAVPTDLPPGVQDVIKLTQAGLNEDVIIAQLRSAGYVYRLNADQIIALTNAGVSQNVIRALIEPTAPAPLAATGETPAAPALSSANPPPEPPAAPPAAPEAAATDAVDAGAAVGPVAGVPPAAPANLDYFENELSPYGMWIQVPGYGWAWVPSAAAGDPSWEPYVDQGYWLYTDAGWYWDSYYPWGGIAFHYGRWTRFPGYGWGWIPDYNWGPAWVCWRHDQLDGYCGWAPLPPEARFVAGLGIVYRGHLAVDIDFGLPAADFVFCSYDHLLDRNFRAGLLPRDRFAAVFARSEVHNGYRIVGGRFAVESLGRANLVGLTHRDLNPTVIRSAPARAGRVRMYPQPGESYYRNAVRPQSYQGYRAGVPYPDPRAEPARPAEGVQGRTPEAAPERRPPAPPAKEAEPAKKGSDSGRSDDRR
jgi:hypothetical protein